MDDRAVVIGAGLAGVEAAWQLAWRGVRVKLYEAKPAWFSPAHKSENFAELVCSNSLKSEEEGHATSLLKEEMRLLGSIVLEAADAMRVPAGKALAVDREGFSKYITEKICLHPNIEVIREEVKAITPSGELGIRATIIATGPLTSPSFADFLQQLPNVCHSRESGNPVHPNKLDPCFRRDDNPLLYFYDAIAPIVETDTIGMKVAFRASRYDVGKKEEGDYINCPMTRDEYYNFIDALLKADQVQAREFDKIPYFEGCMPIEEMAGRHPDALRHGPMKPMGLRFPRTGDVPYAVVQLRQDNLHATLYNMVGFQTRMTYPAQDSVFRMIRGLEHAKFMRYGSMHRNTYINGPLLLDETLQLKSNPGIYVAGQLTGVEGYLESAATGLYVGGTYAPFDSSATGGLAQGRLPPTTAIGALIRHVTRASPENYQPMKMSWGLFPPIDRYPSSSRGPKKDERKKILLTRARNDFKGWL